MYNFTTLNMYHRHPYFKIIKALPGIMVGLAYAAVHPKETAKALNRLLWVAIVLFMLFLLLPILIPIGIGVIDFIVSRWGYH